MTSKKGILVSGVKPTGRPHIGNYFGAMKQFVDLQNEYDCFIFIADLHSITNPDFQDRDALSQAIVDLAIDYLAIGVDPKKVTFYKQSDIFAHTELAWIFNCITTMPYLMRAHAYKDAVEKNKEINVGVFDYPMLMAADILLYDAKVVPVGQDQKQHVEYTRDTAEKFNRIFGETFILPEPLIQEHVGVIPGTDGQKMSKSYQNTIGLFATDEEIKKAVMSIPTDSKGIGEPKDPDTCKVFAFHKLFTEKEKLAVLRRRYIEGGIGYKESKEVLIESMITFIAPLREKREKIARDRKKIIKILKKGGERAKKVAETKMEKVREKIGTKLY